jgi:hypothetical protein
MNKDSDFDSVDFANSSETLANETSRLLFGLNRAVDHSSALRDIIRRQEALQELEDNHRVIAQSSIAASGNRRDMRAKHINSFRRPIDWLYSRLDPETRLGNHASGNF